ncbi:MAG: hypothetical protein ABI618_17710, partial [Nitrospirota bacterium]
MIRPVLFGATSVIISIGLGGAVSGVLGAEPSVSMVQAGAKHIIDHKGMQTTGPIAQLDTDGTLHLAWGGEKQEERGIFYLKVPPHLEQYPEPNKVNPSSPPPTSLHEPPALALGHTNDVYITWT